MARLGAGDVFLWLYWGAGAGLAWFAFFAGGKPFSPRRAGPTVASLLVLGLTALWLTLRPWLPLDRLSEGFPRPVQWTLLFLPMLAFWGVGAFYLQIGFGDGPPIEIPRVSRPTIRFAAACFGSISALSMIYALMWVSIGLATALTNRAAP